MARRNKKGNENGVSESIGFLLIFTIVIAGIGLVTLYGYPLLLQQQISADEKIMEKNMIVLQNDVKSLAYKTVPFKETSLKIGSGALTVYNSAFTPSSSKFDITYSTFTENPSFIPGELRYESVSGQTDISLQNGAVMMRPRLQPGSTMLAEPRWFYDEPTNTVVINLIRITSDDLMAKEGIGTVRMKLIEISDPYTSIDNPGLDDVVIEYTPDSGLNGLDYSVAWDNYITKTFSDQLGSNFVPDIANTPGDTNQLKYTLRDIDRLVLKRFEVKIESI